MYDEVIQLNQSLIEYLMYIHHAQKRLDIVQLKSGEFAELESCAKRLFCVRNLILYKKWFVLKKKNKLDKNFGYILSEKKPDLTRFTITFS